MEGSKNHFGTFTTSVMEADEHISAESIANTLGVESALSVRDSSRAMRATLFSLGLGPACEVMLAAFGKHTPAPEISGVGARPSYVDVGPDIVLNRGNLTRKMESEYRRENGSWVHKRRGWVLRGVVMTHPLGFSPFADEVEEFAAEHGLVLVDDARGALGSRAWSTSRSAWISAGAGGVAGVVSFNGTGFVLSTNPELVNLVSSQVESLDGDGVCPEALKELRLSGMRARKSLSETLACAGLGEIPETPNYCQTACPEVILITSGERDEAADRLEEMGFVVETDFWPRSIMDASDRQFGYRKGRCPESEELSRKALAVSLK
jgi:dTDP-4-amino-4,6-dideoxygalactose transaminase